jgi:PAS domain S-box-containing protein
MRVLIVEDDLDFQESLADVVRLRGHEVTVVADGESAWSELQVEPFPVIIADWMLPGAMDGLTLCRRIRESGESAWPVILVLSARRQPEDLMAMLEAGADDYLAKPFDLPLLEMRISIAEGRARNRAELRQMRQDRAESRFRALLEAAPDGVVTVNQAGQIILVNAQIERLFGYGRAELTGQAIELLVPERHRGGHALHRGGYMQDPRTRFMGAGLELAGRRKDGTEFPVEVSLSPLAGC